MTEQYKQRVRIYLRPEVLKTASKLSKETGINLSETIENCLIEGQQFEKANKVTKHDKINKRTIR